MITKAELTHLSEKYQAVMENDAIGCSQDQLNKFVGLITTLHQYIDSDDKPAENLFIFLKNMIKHAEENSDFDLASYFENPDVLDEGCRLVKALDKGNPMSKRAKKYLGLGIAATVFGILWIPALILAGIYLAPLTAFSVTYASGLFVTTMQTTAVPVWGLALGVAGTISAAGSIATLIRLAKNPSPGLALCGSAIGALEPIAAAFFLLMVAVGVCLMPFIPVIAGGLMLRKAHQLRKAPQGLALDFANAIPGLAEKTHYGNIKETASRKLKKAKEKLAILKEHDKRNMSNFQKANVKTALAYYTQRVSYLKMGVQLLEGGKEAKLDDPNKKSGWVRQANYSRYKPCKETLLKCQVSSIGINVNDNHKKIRVSLFSPAYNHIEHAQKVEARLREHHSLR